VWQTGDVTPSRDDPGSGLFVPASWSAPKMTGQIPARSLIRAFYPGAQPTEDPKSSVVQAGTGNWYPWEGASSFCLPGKTRKIIVHPRWCPVLPVPGNGGWSVLSFGPCPTVTPSHSQEISSVGVSPSPSGVFLHLSSLALLASSSLFNLSRHSSLFLNPHRRS
jgi:hypothetical protein